MLRYCCTVTSTAKGTMMLNLKMKGRTARILLLITVVLAILNVLIVSLLSRKSVGVRQIDGVDRYNQNNYDKIFYEQKLNADADETDEWLTEMSPKELRAFLQINHSLPTGCRDKNIFVLTLVISTPEDLTRRNAIRNSWARTTTVKDKNILTMFVMGEHPDSRNRNDVIRLNAEITKYRDILKGRFKPVRGVRSSLMVSLGIHWIQDHCQRVKYVLIVHDNMFVNYRRLVKVLEHRDSQSKGAKLWMGNVQKNHVPIRNPSNPYYISGKRFNESIYPPYCISGAGYVMSFAAAKEVYNSFLTYGLFPFIDVLSGLVARDHNWTLVHRDQLFAMTRMRSKPCSVDHVVTAVAPDNPALMTDMVNQLSNRTVLQNCVDPDLETVLPTDINNKPSLDELLKLHLDHPGVCFHPGRNKRDIFIVAFINSHPNNSKFRNAIRKTWASDLSVDRNFIKVFFILGKQTSAIKQSFISTEDAQYHDILQANFVDSFANLTLKVITGLKWITKKCSHASYLYQGDEDTFLNFKSIVRYLKELQSMGKAGERLYLGSRIYGKERMPGKREKRANIKKPKVSDQLYSGRYYPTYCSGNGYILSTDIVPAMYRAALRTPLIGVADAFTGILAKRLSVEPIGHQGFKTWGGRVDACSLRSEDTLTVHGVTKTTEQLYQVWETYIDKSINCTDL